MTAEERVAQQPTVADLLNEARIRRGMTRTAALREMDTTDVTYRNWTRGVQVPGVEWTDIIAEHCGVSRYVVLAAMGILSPAEAAMLEGAFAESIPGYVGSHVDNVVPFIAVA